jgi:FtsH-binding integral membrane protein
MANPIFGTFNRPGPIADQASFDSGLRAYMVRVYNYMASGLALSGVAAVASLFDLLRRWIGRPAWFQLHARSFVRSS